MKKKGTFRRYLNGREVKRHTGMLHKQFQCAEADSYKEDGTCTLKVTQVGDDVEYHAINPNLEDKWLGDE